MATIKLGDKCKDKVSGFTGICIQRTEHLHGCTRITIQPQTLHEGKPIEAHWFDEPQVELMQSGTYKVPQLAKTGGPSGKNITSKPPSSKPAKR